MPWTRRAAVVLLVVGLALAGCGSDDEPGRAAEGSSTTTTTSTTTSTASARTERDPTMRMSPDCTVGTIPEGREVPPGCDRLYSPFLGPGQDCVEGQHPDCVDLDHDGRFTAIFGAGRCLVERRSYDRCRDDDGDGHVDEPVDG